MMKKKRVLFLFVALCIFQMMVAVPSSAEGYSGYLDKVMEMVQERYYQDISEEELLKGALKGIFNAMDDYTTFFNAEEATSFLNTIEGNYQGIGVEITEIPEGIMVGRVFSNSPAEGAGILTNDRIVSVDGKNIGGMTATEAASLIKGEAGTYVELGILRGTAAEPIIIRVQRGVVNISPVTWILDQDIMYIKLESFSGNSSYFFKQALQEMDQKGIRKMILDLRNNPGGEVSQAVNIGRLLVSKGVITKLDFKSEEMRDPVYQSHLVKPKYIPAVLVNGNSASASEILASAIQDSKDGFLVGTKTFGKGVVQNLYPILTPEAYEKYREKYGEEIVDGYEWINKHGVEVLDSELIGWSKITTGHYLTRAGKMIHGVGITPDFIVEDYELIRGVDIQNIKPLEPTGSILLNGVGNDVYNAEKILIVKGYEIDAPDTTLDMKTGDILKQYQKEKGIAVSGNLDDATKNALNEDLRNLRLTIDRQYAKAMELLRNFK